MCAKSSAAPKKEEANSSLWVDLLLVAIPLGLNILLWYYWNPK